MSDHSPIVTTLHLTSVIEEEQIKRSWNFRKANWENFTALLDEMCSNASSIQDLDGKVLSFTKNITTAAKRCIPRGKRKKNWVPYWRDLKIDSLIEDRDNLGEQLKTNNTERNRRLLAEATAKVEIEIANAKRLKWAELCEKLDPRKDSKYWKIAKSLNNCFSGHTGQQSNFIQSSGSPATTNKDIANTLALYYSNASKLRFHKEDKSVQKTSKKLLMNARTGKNNCQDPMSDDITMEELNDAIGKVDTKKSPGGDLIFGHMVKHLGIAAKDCLLDIINTSWRIGKLPKAWKTSIIVPILKPGKSAEECKNYRPIALTSILCKIMERIIHSRIMKVLVEQKTLDFYQGAYRKHHSTVDLLFHLCQSIIDGFQEKPPKKTIAVFLDMSSAFDNVWRQKLVTIAHRHGINGRTLIWIADFLKRRKIRVRFNGVLSKDQITWAGVPQGSVLSPLLFLLYINGIHKHLCEDTRIACFADDIVIWHSSNNIDESANILNNSLKNILVWSQDLKLNFNPLKTCFTVFTTDRRHRKQFRPTILMNNTPLTQTENPKYLGVTLDPELRFIEHIKNCRSKALRKLKIIKCLCGTDWGANPKTLRTTYTTIVRPHLEYAAAIWANASSTALNYLDNVQARAAKIISGAVSSTNNNKIVRECGLDTLEKRRKYQTISFTNKVRSHPTDHISQRTLLNWTSRTRLKRSSTMQYDSEIRSQIGLEHDTLTILEEPYYSTTIPQNTKICLNLVKPCTKKDSTASILEKGIETINALGKRNLVHYYTDGSADETIQKGGAGVFSALPNGSTVEFKVATGFIASNFTSELRAIQKALKEYLTLDVSNTAEGLVIFCDSIAALRAINKGQSALTQKIHNQLEQINQLNKICILQWTPAHVGIPGNEAADMLAKEARNLNDCNRASVTLEDANAYARYRLRENAIKKDHQICEMNANRELTKTIVRLRTGHFRGMKIDRDGTRSYRQCNNCEVPLCPEHIFDCPAILRPLINLGEFPFSGQLYSEKIIEIARCVISVHGYL